MNTNPLDKFDPNTAPNPYATYCPSRYNGGSFKTHAKRASALNALRFQGYGVVYQFKDSGWQEIARINPPEFLPDNCENCSTPIKSVRGSYTSISGKTVLVRVSSSKLAEPLRTLTLCYPCVRALGY